MAVYYLSLYYSKYEKTRKILFYAVVITSTISSFYALMQYTGNEFIWPKTLHHYGSRAVSTFGNPNFFSSYLVVSNLIILYFIFSSDFWYVFVFLLFFNFFALLITQTRSSWLGFFIGFLVVVILNKDIFLKKKRRLILTVVLLIFTIFIFPKVSFKRNQQGVLDRLFEARKLEHPSTSQAVYQRFMIWEAGLNMLKKSPLIGHGWGSFELLFPFEQGKLLLKRKVYRFFRTHANNAHNEIVEVLSQLGIIGFFIYFYIWFLFFKYLIMKIKEKRKPIIVFSLGAVLGFFIDNLLNVTLNFPMPAILFWLAVGFGMGNSSEEKRTYDLKRHYKSISIILFIIIILFFYQNIRYFLGEIYYFKGFKESRRGNIESAIRFCKKSWKLWPYNVDNNYELGNAFARARKYKKAIWAYKEALKANPGYDEIYFNLGVMYMNVGNKEKSEFYIKKSIEINPISVTSYIVLGNLYLNKFDDIEKAKECYKKAIEIEPENVDALNNLGFALIKEKKLKQAYQIYKKILKKEPSYKLARENIIRLIKSLKIPYFKLFKKGEKYVKQEKWSQAIEIYKRIIEINPADLKAKFYLGNIFAKIRKYEKAIEIYKEVSKYVEDPSVHYNLAQVYRAIGKNYLAEEEIKKAERLLKKGKNSRVGNVE